jgi:AsmA family protein
MKRFWKIIGVVVAALVLLVAIAGAALWFGGSPAVAWALGHPVSSMLGRQVRVGSLKMSWGNPSHIVAENVEVANPPWASAPQMFTAKRIEVELFMRSLVWGPAHIPHIVLEGAQLLLETSKDGAKNWDFGLSAAAPKKRQQFPDLRHIEVKDGALTFHNGKTDAKSDLAIAALDLKEAAPAQPLDIAARGTFQDMPVRLEGRVGGLGTLRDTSKPYPVKLAGVLDQLKLDIDGTLAEPLDFDGLDLRLSLGGAKLAEVAERLGVPLPPLPDVRGTAVLKGGEKKWALQAISLKTGKSDLEGGIAIDTNSTVPQLKAELTSSEIDLADFKGLYGAKPATSSAPPPPGAEDASGRVLPNTAIAVNKLPGVDADLSFAAHRVLSPGGLPIDRLDLGLALKNGELTMKALRFATAEGNVDLSFHFTPYTQDSPPKMHAEVDVQHVDLHRLFGRPDMPAMLQHTAGNVGGVIKIDTTGVSTREFLAHMKQDAGFFMENGQLSQLLEQLAPIDVLGALGVYARGDKPTQINCLVSRFGIQAGVATATTFLVDTDQDVITAGGNLNFADETIVLDLKPYNKSVTVVSLRTPVDVRGSFAKPAYHLETGNLIARLGAAIGLGVAFPPAALLPLIDIGLGDDNACSRAYAAQQPPGNPAPKSGSSAPPQPNPQR